MCDRKPPLILSNNGNTAITLTRDSEGRVNITSLGEAVGKKYNIWLTRNREKVQAFETSNPLCLVTTTKSEGKTIKWVPLPLALEALVRVDNFVAHGIFDECAKHLIKEANDRGDAIDRLAVAEVIPAELKQIVEISGYDEWEDLFYGYSVEGMPSSKFNTIFANKNHKASRKRKRIGSFERVFLIYTPKKFANILKIHIELKFPFWNH
jgi:hypothetical protein